MGHHHRKHKSRYKSVQVQEQQNTPDLDLGSMLQNMNLGDIDLSKVDMNKVQSIFDKMKGQGGLGSFTSSISANAETATLPDQRATMLNALKEVIPNKKSKKFDKLMKLIQLANTMNMGNSAMSNPPYPASRQKRHRR